MPNRGAWSGDNDTTHMTTRQLLALAQQTRQQILLAANDLTLLTTELRRQLRAIEAAGGPAVPDSNRPDPNEPAAQPGSSEDS